MNEQETSLFAVGDRVVVSWMGQLVRATVAQVATRGRQRRYAVPRYRLTIDGVLGYPWYEEFEIAADLDTATPSPPASGSDVRQATEARSVEPQEATK